MTRSAIDLPPAYDYLRRAVAAACEHAGAAVEAGERMALAGIAPPSWRKLAVDADYHGVAPLLAPLIAQWRKALPQAVPETARLTFHALANRQRLAAAARERRIDELLPAFRDAGIEIVLLKGAALAHQIYPAVGMRPMADIDALIGVADQGRAAEIVRGLGYVFDTRHSTRFAGAMHHLPVAQIEQSGFRIALELHTSAISHDHPQRLTLANLSEPLRAFARGSGPAGLTLGHIDTLHQLSRHTFSPGRDIKLIHLCDRLRYDARFKDEIDGDRLRRRFPGVPVAISLARSVLSPASGRDAPAAIRDLGRGIVPLSEIAAETAPLGDKLAALFAPPDFWLHGFYSVPPGRSLRLVRTVRHPATVLRWLAHRLVGRVFFDPPR